MHRTASLPIHNVKQRSLLRSRACCCARVLSRLSHFSSKDGLSAAKPIAGLCQLDGLRARRSTHPTKFVSSVSSSRDIRVPGFSFLFLPSQLPIPDRGDGGAPGGGILYPVAPVMARRHVCEAWAVPRNRNGASRRSTVTVLGPLRARLRSCLRLRLRGQPLLPASLPVGQGVPNLPGTAYGPRPGRHL
jgi:hypothetical protein